MAGAYIIGIVFAVVGMIISARLKSKFRHYSKVQLRNGMTGREIAERMLSDHGIYDVKVISVEGQLTDHYDPVKKTVNLSEGVYHERSAAAAAVAAHECGHAVQHARAYSWIMFRSRLVPVVSITSRLVQWIILGGILLIQSFPQLLLFGIILFATTTLFSFVTLPVEYDASRRALQWLQERRMVTEVEYQGAEDSLKWAARTYVVAALGSLATLLYYISVYTNRR